MNRNEYQEYFLGGKSGRCVGLTTLPPLCVECPELLGVLTSWRSRSSFSAAFFFRNLKYYLGGSERGD